MDYKILAKINRVKYYLKKNVNKLIINNFVNIQMVNVLNLIVIRLDTNKYVNFIIVIGKKNVKIYNHVQYMKKKLIAILKLVQIKHVLGSNILLKFNLFVHHKVVVIYLIIKIAEGLEQE